MAEMKVFRGNLTQKISLNTKILFLPDLMLVPKIRRTPFIESITVKIHLVSEDQEKLDNYFRNWSVNVSGDDYMTLKILANTSSVSNSCSKSVVNEEYKELKGVCFESLEIHVPEGMNPVLSGDNKMVSFESVEIPSEHSGKQISRESIDFLLTSLSSTFFDNEKEKVLQKFVIFQKSLGANEILPSDLVKILKTISFDNSKIQSIRILSSFIKERGEAYRLLEPLFAFQSQKEELRVILFP